MATEDLTLKEVEEAKKYDLSPDQYHELKSLFGKRFGLKHAAEVTASVRLDVERELRPKVSSELRPGLREDVEKEMRPKLTDKIRKELYEEIKTDLLPIVTDELRPKIRVEVEKEVSDATKDRALADAKAEIASAGPTPKERDAHRVFIREVELDSLASAKAASDFADTEDQALQWHRRVRQSAFFGLLLTLAPLAFHLYSAHGWGLQSAAYFIPAALAFVTLWAKNSSFYERVGRRVAEYRKYTAEYHILAERAKGLRLVDTETTRSRRELEGNTQSLVATKNQLDSRFLPSASLVQKARHEVRDQLISEMDPEKLLRVEPEIEDEPAPSEVQRAVR
jgi:hypothetical protein